MNKEIKKILEIKNFNYKKNLTKIIVYNIIELLIIYLIFLLTFINCNNNNFNFNYNNHNHNN